MQSFKDEVLCMIALLGWHTLRVWFRLEVSTCQPLLWFRLEVFACMSLSDSESDSDSAMTMSWFAGPPNSRSVATQTEIPPLPTVEEQRVLRQQQFLKRCDFYGPQDVFAWLPVSASPIQPPPLWINEPRRDCSNFIWRKAPNRSSGFGLLFGVLEEFWKFN